MLYQNHTILKRAGVGLGGIALVAASLLSSCSNISSNEGIQEEQTNVTTEDISTEVSELIGQRVTVRSLVEETVGESGFVLEPENGEPILVLNTTGAAFELPATDVPIQVTGEVQSFVATDIENEYGLDLEEDLYADYERQPAIIAQSLALAPNPENLYEDYATYLDQQIAVEGDVRLLDATEGAFALFEEGWVDDIGVLVVGINRDIAGGSVDAIQEGENVVVTGVARQPNAELLQEYNLGWDDSKIQEFLSRYTERPIVVADGVYPSAVDPAPGN
jgi:hypothetical protein